MRGGGVLSLWQVGNLNTVFKRPCGQSGASPKYASFMSPFSQVRILREYMQLLLDLPTLSMIP